MDTLTIVVRGADFTIELELPIDVSLSDLIEELIRQEPSLEAQEFELHHAGGRVVLGASLAELAADGRIEFELILPSAATDESGADAEADSSDDEPGDEAESADKTSETRALAGRDKTGPRSPRRRRVSLSDLMPSGLGVLPKAPQLQRMKHRRQPPRPCSEA